MFVSSDPCEGELLGEVSVLSRQRKILEIHPTLPKHENSSVCGLATPLQGERGKLGVIYPGVGLISLEEFWPLPLYSKEWTGPEQSHPLVVMKSAVTMVARRNRSLCLSQECQEGDSCFSGLLDSARGANHRQASSLHTHL
jgi:hypothetical protein